MTEIITVCFQKDGKQYYFAPNGLTFQPGQGVMVETSNGMELGQCVAGNFMIDEMELLSPLRAVVRAATPEDYETVERNKEKARRVLAMCQEKVAQYGLDMKLVEARYNFEGNKVIIFFTSEGRVDFRALVKDLASAVHARIELRQIGVRDEAKMLGGLGICGRPFCCAQFLDEFQPVSIKMAKTQNLSLNPTKISGTCGRLMCCLKYEQEAYEDLVRTTPKMDSFVETPDGVGTVCSVNLLRQKVGVRLENDPNTPCSYHNCEVCVVRSGKGKRPEDYVAPPPEELAKLRKVPEVSTREKQEWKDLDEETVESAPDSAEPQSGHSQNRRRRNRNRNASRAVKENPSREASTREEPKESTQAARTSGNRRRRRRRSNAGQQSAGTQEQ